MEVCTDDLVCCLVCIGEVAWCLLVRHRIRQKGECRRRWVPLLHGGFVKVDGAAVDACRRTGLKAHELQAKCSERVRECHCRTLSVRAAVVDGLAEDDAPAQVRPRGENHGACRETFARLAEYTRDTLLSRSFLCEKLRHKQLAHIEVLCVLNGFLHDALIEELVRLHTEGVDGRAFARVEETALNARAVGGNAHLPAERIDLADEVALAGAADGWIARHHGDVVKRERDDEGALSQTRSGKCRLDARVPCANHDDIIICSGIHIRIPLGYVT